MKINSILMTIMTVIVLTAGCSTLNDFPNANLNKYEARARKAIANMPVGAWYSSGPLPKSHPWFDVIKAQNLRIARTPANFYTSIDTHAGCTILSFHFSDPEGFEDTPYVEFDMSTGEMLNCTLPICSSMGRGKLVTDGIPLPKPSRTNDSVVAVGMPYQKAVGILRAWGARETTYGFTFDDGQGFDLPDEHILFAFGTSGVINKLTISLSPNTNEWSFTEIQSIDLQELANTEQFPSGDSPVAAPED